MKKFIAGVLSLCMIGGAMPLVNNYAPGSAITASAEERYGEVIEGYFRFYVYSDHAELAECGIGEKVDFIIPSEVYYRPVTVIRSHAFAACHDLKSVIIPDTVTSIGNSAFLDTSIESITIPDSVKSLGEGAFENCTLLKSITIPDSVKSLGKCTFENCTLLKSITIPHSVTTIDNYAFNHCNSLETVTILNPDCKIYNSTYTINNGPDSNNNIYFNGTICGYANSTAQAYANQKRYKFEALPDEPSSEAASTLKGDANLDKQVNIADAVLVMQVATNPDKYAQGKSDVSIKPQGEINADVDGKSGLSNSDALLIQKFKLGLIDKF